MAGGYLLGLHWTASEMLTLMAVVLLVATLGAALLTPLMRHAALASATDDPSRREQAALAAGTGRVD
jgi:multisubunit Na+/H+ antiporter MnhG subunit